MKKSFTFVICILITGAAMAQMPQAINYQAVARNNSGVALANQAIKVRLSIVNTIGGNSTLYSETRNVTTNPLGLFHVQIGGPGALSTTGNFASINWSNNTSTTKALKVELDVANSGAFTDMGTQSLVTVPYAFAADKAVDAINIGGHYVDTNTPTTGDLLQWDGNAWVATKPVSARIPKVYSLGVKANPTINGSSLAFVWAAPPVEVTLSAGQVVTIVTNATLGSNNGTPTQVGIAPIYQSKSPFGSLTYIGSEYQIVASISSKSLFTVSGCLKVVASNITPVEGEIVEGTYFFGFGVRNVSPTALNNNGSVQGFVMVN